MIILRSGELAVRTAEKGGGITSTVQVGPGTAQIPRGRVLLLIHGYSNDLADARKSYGTFSRNLSSLASPSTSFHGRIFRFHWPGDKAWGWLRFLSYPFEIGPAKQSAHTLANFLRTLVAPVELYLVCHSLGNRLAMELFDDFVQNGIPPAVRLKGICMMAAAVPVSAVRWPGSLHYASLLTRAVVLFSPGDIVLRLPFLPGQAAGFDSYGSQAVGLNGEPLLHWKSGQPMTYGKAKKKYNHGDYWKQPETAEPVTKFLSRSVSASIPKATLPSHSLPLPNQLRTTGL
jgi:hypothetical protein